MRRQLLWPSNSFIVLGYVVLLKRLEVLEQVVVFALPADMGADGVPRPAARSTAIVVSEELVPKRERAAAGAFVDWHGLSIRMPLASMSVQPGLVCILFGAPVCFAMVFACRTQAEALHFLMRPASTKVC